MESGEKQKSQTARREIETLEFWKENKIFEKSLEKESPKGEFVFYDGPPFATGLPHYGSLLSSIVKDVIPRYKTMRGYHVRRRFGWDCHGLPIENMIEKELGIKTKKEIEKFGVAKFNEACRASVLRYADAWKEYIDRIGRWVEYDNAYKTMDVSYMESVWWALKRLHEKKLLYEGRKVLLYCPRCETPLAKAEVAMDNSYKDVTEEAVTVGFKVSNPKKHSLPNNTHILAWTTTPWTLPGNVALAVGNDISYILVEDDKKNFILAKERMEEGMKVVKKIKGSELVGLEYEPLYEIEKIKKGKKKAWYVTDADFVNTEEGTGVVHTAVIYGEDDYQLGLQKDLPMIPLLDASGHFNSDAPKEIQGEYFKKAEKYIKEDLEKRGSLFKREMNTHSYPHCHRCDTPLLYNAINSWFINIQQIKNRLIRLNGRIEWAPEHIKNGRFLYTLKEAPDWTISRNRYWASALPVWKCVSCSNIRVVGSIDELKKHTKKSGNRYFVMRHGGAESNEKGVASTNIEDSNHLTEIGEKEVTEVAERIYKEDIDVIISSPYIRTKETAEIIRKNIKLTKDKFIFDKRLGEFDTGSKYHGKPWTKYYEDFNPLEKQYTTAPQGGETRLDVRQRATDLLYELEEKYINKKILLISHEGPIWELRMAAIGANLSRSIDLHKKKYSFNPGHVEELPFVPLPHASNGEIDLHRPYIDKIKLSCSCGEEMERVSEVVDGWVESGSMPFAEYHYPFENKKIFKKRSPGDFVSEYIAQTRTWFYYMHAISGSLFRKPSFRSAVVTGNILGSDGNKMSKSKGNYTDPFENLDEYGADALRYYLMTSTVMQAEDVRFLDEELREAHNRVVNILSNVVTFYGLYKSENTSAPTTEGVGTSTENVGVEPPSSDFVLDRWILARLRGLVGEVTENFEQLDILKTGRPIREFIEDLSTWYVRRSRDRFKSSNNAEKDSAINTTRFVLLELSKVIAPIMPFIAENIYQSVRESTFPQSVHLDSWPKASSMLKAENKKLIKDMEVVRELVSRGLEARVRAGIKVRQPLAKLTVSTPVDSEFLLLIKDEVNVKEVVVDDSIVERVRLDIDITDELREEGEEREYIRFVQNLRKKGDFKPTDVIQQNVQTNEKGQEFLKKLEANILTSTKTSSYSFENSILDGEEIAIGENNFVVRIVKK